MLVAGIEAERADYAACVLGLRDYVNKNGFPGVVIGLSGGIDSALVARDGGRCARRRARACVMLPYQFTASGIARRRGGLCAKALGRRLRRSLPIAPAVEGLEQALAPAVRRQVARRHRGESAKPRARHHSDGDLQQVRPDGRDHRQQVGNVGRLRHALRRHERRLQSDQGSLQDAGVPPVARCAMRGSPIDALGPDGEVIPENIITSPPTAELRENQTDRGLAAALRGSRSRSSSGWSSARMRGLDHRWRAVSIVDTVVKHRAPALHRRIQAPPIGAGREGDAQEFRPRPPLPHRQPLPRTQGPPRVCLTRASRHGSRRAGRRGLRNSLGLSQGIATVPVLKDRARPRAHSVAHAKPACAVLRAGPPAVHRASLWTAGFQPAFFATLLAAVGSTSQATSWRRRPRIWTARGPARMLSRHSKATACAVRAGSPRSIERPSTAVLPARQSRRIQQRCLPPCAGNIPTTSWRRRPPSGPRAAAERALLNAVRSSIRPSGSYLPIVCARLRRSGRPVPAIHAVPSLRRQHPKPRLAPYAWMDGSSPSMTA